MNDKLTLTLREVFVYEQKKENVRQNARSFCALSFKATTSCRYTVDGREVAHTPGALCLVPAGVAYRRESEREDIFVLHFDASPALPPHICVLQVGDVAATLHKFKTALSLWQRREAGDHYRVAAILHELFADVIAPVEQEETAEGDYLADAVRYIEKHLGDPALTVDALAKRAFVSPANFRRRFGARFDCSPKQYLDRARMARARSLLETAYFTTAEVAARCGFSDVAYFCNAFRRHTGESVSAFRKRSTIK